MKEEITFKPKFVERYSKLTNWEKFKEYSLKFLRRSIRVNTLKISVQDLKKRLEEVWELEQIPWCKEGFWIEHRGINEEKRRDIGNLIEHSLGYIYIQEAASMIPPIVLDVKPGQVCLDMCASPGSKASQIAAMLEGKGFLVTNDYKGKRLAPLGINLQRMGVANSIINLGEGRFFKDMEFDRILVDAPCSGTGTVRKSLKTLKIWNPNMIRRLAGTQRQLITTAFDILKPGGIMVYSTCSCEVEENEEVIDYLLNERENAEVLDINLPLNRTKPFLEYEGKKYNKNVEKALRLFPQDNDTEGFFVCKIHKN
jgi:tRNA (cytosine49-C5)-methyltransferase